MQVLWQSSILHPIPYWIRNPITNKAPDILLNISVDFIAGIILFSSEIDDFSFFMEFIATGIAASEIKQKTGIMDIATQPMITPYDTIGKI